MRSPSISLNSALARSSARPSVTVWKAYTKSQLGYLGKESYLQGVKLLEGYVRRLGGKRRERGVLAQQASQQNPPGQ